MFSMIRRFLCQLTSLPLPQLIVAMKQARRDAQDVAARVGQFEVDFASLKRWHEACIFDNTLSYEEYEEYYNRSSRELQAAVKEKDDALERLGRSESAREDAESELARVRREAELELAQARQEAELELDKVRQELQQAQASVAFAEARTKEAEASTVQANLRAGEAEERVERLSSTADKLRDDLSEANGRAQRAADALVSAQSRVGELEKSLEESAADLKREMEFRVEAAEKAEEAEQALRDEEDKVSELEARIRELKAEGKQLVVQRDGAVRAAIKEAEDQVMAYENRGFRHGWMAAFERANLPAVVPVPLEYPDIEPAPSGDQAASSADGDSDGAS